MLQEDYLRSALFGLQDGLVSTTGVVVGIATGVPDKAVVILASFVAVTVEASSMAAGQYTSEQAVHQMDKKHRHKDSVIKGAIIMLISYLFAGSIPIIPMILFNPSKAKYLSVMFAFVGLFIIGYVKGKVVGEKSLRSAMELFIIGSTATLVGLIVGKILKV